MVGFTAMALISLTATFFLSRYKMATDLQKLAAATAEAFRSRILEGDIKAVENQIHGLLGLTDNEDALILDSNRQPLYLSTSTARNPILSCRTTGFTCFDGYSSPGRIFHPIYFDEKKQNIFGYLYLSKLVKIDWLYVIMIFLIFSFGNITVLLGLREIIRTSSKRLAEDVETWAIRLRVNPKSHDPLSNTPFAELAPLHDSIEGLTAQIEYFESKASEKAKMLVLRGIAHDLLSPVSQAQLYMATLEQQIILDRSSREILGEIKSALKEVSIIASQVKSLEDNNENTEFLSLSEVVKSEIESLQKRDLIKSRNIKIQLSTPEDVQSPLSRSEIARILQNLIENAVDASDMGSIIEVKVEKEETDSILSVTDKGCGIPDHLRERIFDPDFTSKPSTGTGLGLFIVKHICEQKHGSVRVDSQKNHGTTITVLIPSNEMKRGLDAI